MIDLSFNLATQVVRLVQSATVKPGGSVPVRVTFSAAPSAVGLLQLTLGSDASPPETLAFTDVFLPESNLIWTAWLDLNDSRLVTFLNGQSTTVNAELTVGIDDHTHVSSNLPITVQPRILSGPGSSVGGPNYYTATEVENSVAAALANLTLLDGSNGQTYRLTSNNGIIGLEPVS